jgi:hypothetical protein
VQDTAMAKDIAKFATEKPDSPKTYHAENLPKTPMYKAETPTSQVCLTSPFINILLQAIVLLEQVSKFFMSHAVILLVSFFGTLSLDQSNMAERVSTCLCFK